MLQPAEIAALVWSIAGPIAAAETQQPVEPWPAETGGGAGETWGEQGTARPADKRLLRLGAWGGPPMQEVPVDGVAGMTPEPPAAA